MTFGEYFHSFRIKQGITLRKFCEKIEEDPGNISRLEREKLRAPKSKDKLKFYAEALGLSEGTTDYDKFFELASISNRTYGIDEVQNDKILERLPVFLRTIDNKGLDENKLDDLIKLIKES